MPISNVLSSTFRQGGFMLTIGKISQKATAFFKPVKRNVSAHVYSYYSRMVIAMCVSHACTIDCLVKVMRKLTVVQGIFRTFV